MERGPALMCCCWIGLDLGAAFLLATSGLAPTPLAHPRQQPSKMVMTFFIAILPSIKESGLGSEADASGKEEVGTKN
jgi:hypothetical protein